MGLFFQDVQIHIICNIQYGSWRLQLGFIESRNVLVMFLLNGNYVRYMLHKNKRCNDNVVVSIVSETRDCCDVVCGKRERPECVLRLVDEYMLYRL